MSDLNVVTGAFGYTGKYITQRLLARQAALFNVNALGRSALLNTGFQQQNSVVATMQQLQQQNAALNAYLQQLQQQNVLLQNALQQQQAQIAQIRGLQISAGR